MNRHIFAGLFAGVLIACSALAHADAPVFRVTGKQPLAGNRGYTSNGINSTVMVIELSTLRVIETLHADKKSDAITYDPTSHSVFVANGGFGTLTVIDTKTDKVIDTRYAFGM